MCFGLRVLGKREGGGVIPMVTTHANLIPLVCISVIYSKLCSDRDRRVQTHRTAGSPLGRDVWVFREKNLSQKTPPTFSRMDCSVFLGEWPKHKDYTPCFLNWGLISVTAFQLQWENGIDNYVDDHVRLHFKAGMVQICPINNQNKQYA